MTTIGSKFVEIAIMEHESLYDEILWRDYTTAHNPSFNENYFASHDGFLNNLKYCIFYVYFMKKMG